MLNKLKCFLTQHSYTGDSKITELDRIGITKYSWNCQRCGKEEYHLHYNGVNKLIEEYINAKQE